MIRVVLPLIVALTVGMLAGPLDGRAGQAATVPRIGILQVTTPATATPLL